MKNGRKKIKTIVRIAGKIPWRYCHSSDTDKYIAVCDVLGLTIQAENYPELLEGMGEAVDETFRELLNTNDLENFLTERGWKSISPLPKTKSKRVSFEIPIQTDRFEPYGLQNPVC